MNDKYSEAFDEIALAVARLIFGDSLSQSATVQSIVKHALLSVGVYDVLKGLRVGS